MEDMIEEVRHSLNMMVSDPHVSLNNGEVLILSEKLDKLIIIYEKYRTYA